MLDAGVLLSPDYLQGGYELPESVADNRVLVLSGEVVPLLEKEQVNWGELEKARAIFERTSDQRLYLTILEALREEAPQKPAAPSGAFPPPEVVSSYQVEAKSWKVQDFVSHLRARLTVLSRMLREHKDLQGAAALRRLQDSSGHVCAIGLVREKRDTKGGNVLIVLEDQSGWAKILVSSSKPELFRVARDISPDEVLGVIGSKKGDFIFANDIILPDIPLSTELKKYPGDCAIAVISDIHAGSTNFLEQEFDRFLQWIRGEFGTEEQRQLAKKVGYLFVVGDLVAGVGVYPGQEEELVLPGLAAQFKRIAELLSRVPERIHIIAIPGNHDGIRLAEPQPAFSPELAGPLLQLPNLTLVSNPSLIRILRSDDFPGFDVLLYHGYSFVHYAESVDTIRSAGGVDKPEEIMRYLLTRRHLAPTHGSAIAVPDPACDPLVIDTVPDFFLSGHLHKSAVANYRNVTMICGSCWEQETSFQKKLGLHPEPARVPVIDLRTRDVKVLKFGE